MSIEAVPQVRVRQFEPADSAALEAAEKVFHEAFPLHGGDPKEFLRSIKKEGQLGFLALMPQDDQEPLPVGVATGDFYTRAYAGTGEARLSFLGVTQQARRQGVGRLLLQTVEAAALARHKNLLTLQSSGTQAATRFYLAAGFRVIRNREMHKTLSRLHAAR
jgi:GNAT superfamily N-acetyltransferase